MVTRYHIFLESRQLAARTINGRLAAVRRLAYEAADAGLLSPELAAGIRRVKGAKKLDVRLGTWLTADEARRFWQSPAPDTLKGMQGRAILTVLLGCGLSRRKLRIPRLGIREPSCCPYQSQPGSSSSACPTWRLPPASTWIGF